MAEESEGCVIGGDAITIQEISESKGVAIGHGARVEMHYHYEYVERPKLGTPYLAPTLPPHHVPREAALVQLRELLVGKARQVTALRGMGGVGKTTLAIALCHDRSVVDSFSDGILWATLGPRADLLSAQTAWGAALGHDLTKLPDAEARASHLRSLLHDKRCLLVIDDVWEAAHLAPMQVGGEQCATLVTTRERKIAQKVGVACELDVLTPDESVTLLESWAKRSDAGTLEEAVELAQRLGYLPLALRLAGAQAQDGETWESLLTSFRDVQQADVTLLDMDDPTMRDESLKLAFDLSLQRLREPLQAQFALLGVFGAGREAPFEAPAAAAVWQVPSAQARKTLRRLARAALLDREDDHYLLHLLVGDYARSILDEETRQAAEARHNTYYLGAIQRHLEDWQAIEAALPQIRTTWRRVPKDDADGLYAWAAATNEFFHRRGYWADSITWIEATRSAATAAGQPEHRAWCNKELGWLSHSCGRLDDALAQYQASLAIYRELDSQRVEAQLLNRIGYIHFQRGEIERALAQFHASLDICNDIGDQAGKADSLHMAGLIYQRRGELDEALSHYQASLDIQHEVGNWRVGAVTLQNVGRIHEQRGELEEALTHYQAALTIQQEIGDRAAEGATVVSVGRIHEQRGELDEALAHYQTALDIHRSSGNQLWAAYALNGVGRVHYQRAEFDDAMEQFRASLTILRMAGDQVGQAESLWNIARTCDKMERLAEAEARLAESLDLYDKMGVPEAAQVRDDLDRVRKRLSQSES
jgi:tetratricopeptide (TPR) repeat protein